MDPFCVRLHIIEIDEMNKRTISFACLLNCMDRYRMDWMVYKTPVPHKHAYMNEHETEHEQHNKVMKCYKHKIAYCLACLLARFVRLQNSYLYLPLFLVCLFKYYFIPHNNAAFLILIIIIVVSLLLLLFLMKQLEPGIFARFGCSFLDT